MENGKFTIIDDQGKEIMCDALFTFDSDETKKSYVVYTDGTKDLKGALQIFAKSYKTESEKTKLESITSDREWKVVETILKTLEDEVKNRKKDQNNEQ